MEDVFYLGGDHVAGFFLGPDIADQRQSHHAEIAHAGHTVFGLFGGQIDDDQHHGGGNRCQ